MDKKCVQCKVWLKHGCLAIVSVVKILLILINLISLSLIVDILSAAWMLDKGSSFKVY